MQLGVDRALSKNELQARWSLEEMLLGFGAQSKMESIVIIAPSKVEFRAHVAQGKMSFDQMVLRAKWSWE